MRRAGRCGRAARRCRPIDEGQLNAVVTTLLGFAQEVAIRVAGSADGAKVAMRSATLSTFPGFRRRTASGWRASCSSSTIR